MPLVWREVDVCVIWSDIYSFLLFLSTQNVLSITDHRLKHYTIFIEIFKGSVYDYRAIRVRPLFIRWWMAAECAAKSSGNCEGGGVIMKMPRCEGRYTRWWSYIVLHNGNKIRWAVAQWLRKRAFWTGGRRCESELWCQCHWNNQMTSSLGIFGCTYNWNIWSDTHN